MPATLKALAVGAIAALGAMALGTALCLAALHRTGGDGEAMALWIFWPVLVPILLGSVALGLWLSHRLYRRALAQRPRGARRGSAGRPESAGRPCG